MLAIMGFHFVKCCMNVAFVLPLGDVSSGGAVAVAGLAPAFAIMPKESECVGIVHAFANGTAITVSLHVSHLSAGKCWVRSPLTWELVWDWADFEVGSESERWKHWGQQNYVDMHNLSTIVKVQISRFGVSKTLTLTQMCFKNINKQNSIIIRKGNFHDHWEKTISKLTS